MSKPQLLPSYDHRSLLILHSQEALARLAAGERLRLQDIDEDWELQPWADGPCLVVDHDAISIYQVDRGGWRCDDRECSDYVRTLLDRFHPAELCHGVLTKSGDRNLGSVLLDGSPFDVEPRTITLQQLESESCGSIETMTPCLGATVRCRLSLRSPRLQRGGLSGQVGPRSSPGWSR